MHQVFDLSAVLQNVMGTQPAQRWLSIAAGLIFLNACKPPIARDSETTAAQEKQSIQQMTDLIDSGISQLDVPFQDTEEGLSLSAHWQSQANPSSQVYRKIFEKVRSKWNSMDRNPCKMLAPITRTVGREIPYPYFFVGVSAEAGAGVHGIIGRDYVWDFYNMQISAFNYKSIEFVFGSGTLGAGVNAYVGLGFGNKRDVNDAWSGRFANKGVSGSLPVLSDYLSGHISFFHAQTPQGQNDFRFRGGSVGLSAGVSVPTPAPGALQVSSGIWVHDKHENLRISRRLSQAGIKNSLQGSETCQGRCIRIDNSIAGAGYTGRATNIARTLPILATGREKFSFIPEIEKLMLLAIATGAFRDVRNNSMLCRTSSAAR